MNQYLSEEQVNDIQAQARSYTMGLVLNRFFGVSGIDYSKKDGTIKCRFDAQALDGSSEEKMYVFLRQENTPEQNMALLLDARKRQYWYGQKRTETPGLDVPPPKSGE